MELFNLKHNIVVFSYGFGFVVVKNDIIAKKWEQVKDIRKVITGALEVKRADKTIGSSLESHIDIFFLPLIYSTVCSKNNFSVIIGGSKS